MYKITFEIRSLYHLYSNIMVSSDSVFRSLCDRKKRIKSESQGENVTQ